MAHSRRNPTCRRLSAASSFRNGVGDQSSEVAAAGYREVGRILEELGVAEKCRPKVYDRQLLFLRNLLGFDAHSPVVLVVVLRAARDRERDIDCGLAAEGGETVYEPAEVGLEMLHAHLG